MLASASREPLKIKKLFGVEGDAPIISIGPLGRWAKIGYLVVLIGAALLMGPVLVKLFPPAKPQTIEFNQFQTDVDLEQEFDTLVFVAGARLQIRNGARVMLRAKRVIIKGPVTVDGVGKDGAPGQVGACCPRGAGLIIAQHHDDKPRSMREWEAAGNGPDDVGGQGGRGEQGGRGASLTIQFQDLEGAPSQFTIDVRGGRGGIGGPGGPGRLLTERWTNRQKRGPSGPSGLPGEAGSLGCFQMLKVGNGTSPQSLRREGNCS